MEMYEEVEELPDLAEETSPTKKSSLTDGNGVFYDGLIQELVDDTLASRIRDSLTRLGEDNSPTSYEVEIHDHREVQEVTDENGSVVATSFHRPDAHTYDIRIRRDED